MNKRNLWFVRRIHSIHATVILRLVMKLHDSDRLRRRQNVTELQPLMGLRRALIPVIIVNSDAAFDANGNLEALPYWSAMIGLTHRWNDHFRSTVSYGYVNLDNASGQDATFSIRLITPAPTWFGSCANA